jgi:hypothetical protein
MITAKTLSTNQPARVPSVGNRDGGKSGSAKSERWFIPAPDAK